MDAITSFSYLVDNLPRWREEVSQLCTYTSQKHEEFKAEYNRLVSQAKPKRVKSPSICSIHTNDDTEQYPTGSQRGSTPQPPNPADISPFEAGNRYIYAQANKKRKPGTSFRSGASGPLKFRNKQMVVIYYDSHVQEKLDSLVKAIGGSRNNLRKGKMAYTVSQGLQLPTLGRKYDLPSPGGLDGVRSSSAYRSAPKLPVLKGGYPNMSENLPTGEAAFKQADKELETCQNLCETAAHQFLRDGDCKLELDSVVINLDKAFALAKSTLQDLKADQMKSESPTESSSVTESDATLVQKVSREALSLHSKLGPSLQIGVDGPRPPLPSIQSAPPMLTEIEVDDDSDQSSIELDLSKFRTLNRAGNRSRVQA